MDTNNVKEVLSKFSELESLILKERCCDNCMDVYQVSVSENNIYFNWVTYDGQHVADYITLNMFEQLAKED